MPGVLTHFVVSIIGLVSLRFIFGSWKYGLVFLIGHLIPDLIKFGIPAIRLGTLTDFTYMMTDALYPTLNIITSSFSNWAYLSLFIVLAGFLVWKLSWISEKLFIGIVIGAVCFVAGVYSHLIMDIYIIESSYWI